MAAPQQKLTNPKRLLADLHKLRSFGSVGNGVVRPALTPIDVESRHWLVERMREAGLDAQIDGIGNVFGRDQRAAHTLLLGSHTDTQPEGGWLDGSMGVIYALEVARALRESGRFSERGVDIASWVDEEMRFANFLGSRTFAGLLEPTDAYPIVGRDGVALEHALRQASLIGRPVARLDPKRHIGYLEAHIEQGGILEASNNRLGVVTAIVGIRSLEIEFSGQQNHAGTTPMHLRRDAGTALLKFWAALEERLRPVVSPGSVWTVGRVVLHPGAESIVPGKASLLLQLRDVDSDVLARMELAATTLGSEVAATTRAEVAIRPTLRNAVPAKMNPRFQQALAEAAQLLAPGHWMTMPSGAGHDAQVFSPLMPTGMLFVPSIGGISHSFDEDTREEDIALGCEVFTTAICSLLDSLP
jgi:beta-ureidopropionase / N-carbamoyl-L-amino-acid hydrolase